MSDRQQPTDRGPERESAPRLPGTVQKTEKTAAQADLESGWHNADGTPYEGDPPPTRGPDSQTDGS